MPVKETVTRPEKKLVNQSLNEEAKKTKKTISTIIEQQKDIEDILSDLTKGEEDVEGEEVVESDHGSSESEDEGEDLQEEEEILEDDE